VVTWNLSTLPPGDQTVCLRAETSAALRNGDVIRNTAEAVDIGNNTAEDSITTEVVVKALRVRILDLDDPVQQGGQIRYMISVDNLGDVPMGDDPETEKVEKVMVATRVPAGTSLDCISGSMTIDCAPPAEGVTLGKDPSIKGRRAIWTLDEPLGTVVGENSRTVEMVITLTESRRRVLAKAKAREFTLRSISRSRALTVVEENQ
jgi:hypothetical protein